MASKEVGNLTVKMSLESADFERSISSMNRTMRALKQELNGLKNNGREWGNSLSGLKTKQDALKRAVESQAVVVKKLSEAYQESVEKNGENSKKTEDLAIALNRAQAEYNKFKTELDQVTAAIENQKGKMQSLGDSMQSVGKKIKSAGESMKDVGKKLTTAVSLPLAAIGTGATKAAIDFESAFAGVKKTVNGSEEDFKKLETGIREMAKELPTSAEGIAGVAEQAGQLGIEKESILAFTRTIIDLGESTNLSLEQASTEFARFANITGMSQDNFDRLGSVVVALGNTMATTESEVSSMAMRLAAQGKQVGMTESDIMGLSATMSSLGEQKRPVFEKSAA